MMLDRKEVFRASAAITGTLLPYAKDRVRLNELDPFGIHGVPHWYEVWLSFLMLAGDQELPVDIMAGAIFSVLHDCERLDDNHDPVHGMRAGTALAGLWHIERHPYDALPTETVLSLVGAMISHSEGRVSDDALVSCCWDADRIDLPRVGVEPDPEYMSTSMGKWACKDRQGFMDSRADLAENLGIALLDINS